MPRLPALIALAAYSRTIEGEFTAELSPAERAAVGQPDAWAAKDIVAHVATWRADGAAELEAVHRGPLPPELEEFDEANRAIFDRNHDLPWDVVERRAGEAWDLFVQNLERVSEEQLDASATTAGTGRPLWRRVSVDAGNHPALHYAEFARRGGRNPSATRWMEGVTPLLLAVDPSDEWHGVAHYNLACHYAQCGMTDEALRSLARSLEYHPGLREWSRKDPDLVSLHSDRRFRSTVDANSA
jgi:hypothetical protein